MPKSVNGSNKEGKTKIEIWHSNALLLLLVFKFMFETTYISYEVDERQRNAVYRVN